MVGAATDFAIRIGVEDKDALAKFAKLDSAVKETADKWSSFGNAGRSAATDLTGPLEKIVGSLTPLNVGLAAAGTAMAGFGVATYAAMSALRGGGEFNEVRKGFDSLATSAGVSSKSIVSSINSIAGGTLSFREIMESSSKAIRAGFGEDQIETVYKFAKRFSEATGESFTGTAENIVKALQTGRTQSLRQYGIMLEDGATFAQAFGKITDLAAAFGGGAFNFGDIETALVKQIGNLADVIGATWNDMLGDSVTGDALENIVSSFDTLIEMGPMIAESIGAPVIAALDALIGTGRQIYDVYTEVVGVTGISFGDAISTGAAIAVEGIAWFGKTANVVLSAFAKYAELAIGTWSTLASVVGASDLSAKLDSLTGKIKSVQIETSGLERAATGLYYGFDSQSKAADGLGLKHTALAGAIKTSKNASDESAGAIEKAEKAMEKADAKADAIAAKEQERAEKKIAGLDAQIEKQIAASKAEEDALQKKLDAAATVEERAAAADELEVERQKNKAEIREAYAKRNDEIVAAEQAAFAAKRIAEAQEAEDSEKLTTSRIGDLDRYAAAAKGARAAAQGIGDNTTQSLGSATSAMLDDTAKSREIQENLVASNNSVVAAVNKLLSSGLSLGVKVTSGTSELAALVKRMIQEAQIMAVQEGAKVAGV